MSEGRSSARGGGSIGVIVFSALIAIGTAGSAFAQDILNLDSALPGLSAAAKATIAFPNPQTNEQNILPTITETPVVRDVANEITEVTGTIVGTAGVLCERTEQTAAASASATIARVETNAATGAQLKPVAGLCPAVLQTLAGVAQAVNNTAQIASNLTQDIIAAALDGDIQPETSTLAAVSAGSPGQTMSNFMVSGYKFLSHDGFTSSSANASFKTPEFEEQNYGLTVGTRFDGSTLFDVAPGSVTLGVVGNYTHTEIEVGATKIGEAEVDSWSVGTFGLVTDGQRYGLFTLTGTFGSPETSSTTVLPVNAEFNNFALSTSAVAGYIVPLGDSKLDLRGGVNYIRASGDDYTDSIGIAYTDSHLEEFSGSVSARLFRTVKLDDAIVRPFVQGGLTHRFHYENELIINGEKFSFDDADTSVFARAGVDFDIGRSTQAYLSVRGDASEDFEAIAAQVGVTFKLD